MGSKDQTNLNSSNDLVCTLGSYDYSGLYTKKMLQKYLEEGNNQTYCKHVGLVGTLFWVMMPKFGAN